MPCTGADTTCSQSCNTFLAVYQCSALDGVNSDARTGAAFESVGATELAHPSTNPDRIALASYRTVSARKQPLRLSDKSHDLPQKQDQISSNHFVPITSTITATAGTTNQTSNIAGDIVVEVDISPFYPTTPSPNSRTGLPKNNAITRSHISNSAEHALRASGTSQGRIVSVPPPKCLCLTKSYYSLETLTPTSSRLVDGESLLALSPLQLVSLLSPESSSDRGRPRIKRYPQVYGTASDIDREDIWSSTKNGPLHQESKSIREALEELASSSSDSQIVMTKFMADNGANKWSNMRRVKNVVAGFARNLSRSHGRNAKVSADGQNKSLRSEQLSPVVMEQSESDCDTCNEQQCLHRQITLRTLPENKQQDDGNSIASCSTWENIDSSNATIACEQDGSEFDDLAISEDDVELSWEEHLEHDLKSRDRFRKQRDTDSAQSYQECVLDSSSSPPRNIINRYQPTEINECEISHKDPRTPTQVEDLIAADTDVAATPASVAVTEIEDTPQRSIHPAAVMGYSRLPSFPLLPLSSDADSLDDIRCSSTEEERHSGGSMCLPRVGTNPHAETLDTAILRIDRLHNMFRASLDLAAKDCADLRALHGRYAAPQASQFHKLDNPVSAIDRNSGLQGMTGDNRTRVEAHTSVLNHDGQQIGNRSFQIRTTSPSDPADFSARVARTLNRRSLVFPVLHDYKSSSSETQRTDRWNAVAQSVINSNMDDDDVFTDRTPRQSHHCFEPLPPPAPRSNKKPRMHSYNSVDF